jgi:hypothetical protein
MKGIVKLGLVMGVLFCTAFGAASAQEELSEDYKEGFKDGVYMGLINVCSANMQWANLAALYYELEGEPTDETLVVDNETITWSDYYNELATSFNQGAVTEVNNFVLQNFGPDDERTELLLIPELPIIS